MVAEYIHLVTTGGMIDKEYDTRKGTHDFAVGNPAVERILETVALEPNFDYSVESVLEKDSLDTSAEDRQKIRAFRQVDDFLQRRFGRPGLEPSKTG